MNQSALNWLYRVSGRKKGYVLFLTAVEALRGVGGVYFALFLRNVVDCAVNWDREGLFREAVYLVLLLAALLFLQVLLRHYYELAKAEMENLLKNRLFAVLLQKDYSAVSALHSGEWMNRLTNDTKLVAEAYAEILPGLMGMGSRMLGAFVMMLALDPRFAIILLPVCVLSVLVTFLVRGRFKSLHKRIQERDGGLRSFLQERLGAMLLIRAFSAREQSIEQARQLTGEHAAARMRRMRFTNAANLALGIAIHGMYVFTIIWCGYGILEGRITYGTLTAMTQLITQIQTPFVNISAYLPRWYAMLASAERLMEAEAFAEEEEGEALGLEEAQRLYREELRGLFFDRVSFSYPADALGRETDALREASLRIAKGEIVALTGPSGCGKSTLLKLLLGVYKPQQGQVELLTGDGGETLKAAHRRLFAYVPQGNLLLNGSIREAVSLASPERAGEDAALWEALEVACARDFVEALQDGLDTRLGERGAGLSEGQLQRLAIARAVFSGNPILMLDEATASLDGETEERFLRNVKSLRNKTVLIVTHRPAALAICDRELHFSEEGIF